MDLKDFMEFVQTTARSVGAEISSPWFYLQFGLILAAAASPMPRKPGFATAST